MDDVVPVDELVTRIRALPEVGYQQPEDEAAWGGRFFFAGEDRRMPFATIVDRDMPGDDLSRLDRPGLYRFNVQLDRAEFERRFGHPPREEAAGGTDFGTPDTLLPHPVYGPYSWACIVAPTAASLPLIDELAGAALAAALRHRARRDDRPG